MFANVDDERNPHMVLGTSMSCWMRRWNNLQQADDWILKVSAYWERG